MPKGERPQFVGEISLNREKEGKIALWVQKNIEGSKRPILKGNITIGDKKYYVSVWANGYSLVEDKPSE